MRFPWSSPRRLTKTYGRGSLLGFLSPLLAFFMANAGMTGWEEIARRDMERDVPVMLRRGYHVVTSDAVRVGAFGVVVYRVTYERN